MSPDDVERALEMRGIGLQDLQRLVRRERFPIAPFTAWCGLARAILTVAAGEVCLTASPGSPALAGALTVLGSLLAAAGMVAMFVIGHDCGHGSFSRRPRVNTLVGHICMSPILIGFHAWRRAHAHHHAHAQLRGEDTDWPEQMRSRAEYASAPWPERWRVRLAYGSPVGTLTGFVVGMVRRTFMSTLYPQVRIGKRARRTIAFSNVLVVGVSGGIVAALAGFRGGAGVVRFYVVPVYLGMVLGALFTFLHHSAPGSRVFDRHAWSPVRAQVTSAFDVRFPHWFEWLFLHVNRHVPHHVEPRLPWYRLPDAAMALREVVPELGVVRRFTPRYLAEAWGAPILDEAGDGVYVAGPLRVRSPDTVLGP